MKLSKFAFVFFVFSSVFSGIFISPPKISAISESLVIYQVQTAGAVSGTASQELVLLYNQSATDINVTDWCIKYSTSTDSSGFTKCLTAPDNKTELWLSSGGMISFASSEFVSVNSGFVPDVIFSAGMAASAGHLRVLDNLEVEIDKVGWGTAVSPETTVVPAHTTGKVLSRDLNALLVDTDNNLNDFSSQTIQNPIISGLYEKAVIVDICPNIASVQEILPEGFLQDDVGDCYLDVCPNLSGLQINLPEGYYFETNNCLVIPLENRSILIAEIYPDAPSYDTGFEFIEIYNPNSVSINLKGYILQVGPNFTKQFIFSSGVINAGQYLTFSDTQTGIILPNSSGVSLRLITPAGNVVSESGIYQNANEEVSWAIVDDIWIFTNQITPGTANKPYLQELEEEVLGVTSVLAPCAAGKYRNPETNRCRTIETAVSILTPCDEDEYRNPDTNRCNKLASAVSQLVPCKVGQERNPETNRCRAITSSTALSACAEGQERNPETNRCRKVGVLGVSSESDLTNIQDVKVESTNGRLNWLVIVATFGVTTAYMIYEWRSELRQKLYLIKSR